MEWPPSPMIIFANLIYGKISVEDACELFCLYGEKHRNKNRKENDYEKMKKGHIAK